MKNFLITGCADGNGLGAKLAKNIRDTKKHSVIISVDISDNKPDYSDHHFVCDLSDSKQIGEIFNHINDSFPIDCLINCAGVNIADWFEDSSVSVFDKTMAINARAIFQTSQILLKNLSARKGTILNIVSNAAHNPMRCSLAYNASKSAAKMVTMQMARELTKKHNVTVFSISPNKLAGTEMSKGVDEQIPRLRGWTEEKSQEYQLEALVTGKETDPEMLAEFIAFLVSEKERHFYLSGCDIPYGA